MTVDISGILSDWPYQPGQLTARRIRGLDGQEKIQLRLDLGLLQMEVSGRPDGAQPNGCESLLDYYEKQRDLYRKQRGSDEGFQVDGDACELLRAEGLLYYHRYVAEFVLEDFPAVERDTTRNLRLLDFCAAHAAAAGDRVAMELHRPYIMMMRTRARCQGHLAAGRSTQAFAAVERGVQEIKDYFTTAGQEEAIVQSPELAILTELAGEVQSHMPVDPLVKLKRALAKAIAEERYEEAAAIRDRIRRVADTHDRPTAPPRA
ncbi:MAG: UvrB/UvrC motif-containing protein [Phycisphaerae bacterium]|nr:UvrB/UvrC motif-containing protein [Phycisphaerae bacterium]